MSCSTSLLPVEALLRAFPAVGEKPAGSVSCSRPLAARAEGSCVATRKTAQVAPFAPAARTFNVKDAKHANADHLLSGAGGVPGRPAGGAGPGTGTTAAAHSR